MARTYARMKKKVQKRPTPEMNELLRRSGDLHDWENARAATQELTRALTETMPIRRGVIAGDNLADIYQEVPLEQGVTPEFPLDILVPGQEKDHVAYTVPSTGRIPERHVEGDYVTVNTYEITSSIDWALKFSRDARWDVVGRCMQLLEGGFTLKRNRDGWHTIIISGVSRNLVVYDDTSGLTAGLFSKRLISVAKTVMLRKAGGNASSLNRGRLTDVFLSPEALEDVRGWNFTDIDDFTRRQIFEGTGDDSDILPSIFGVNLRALYELGIGQELQTYFTRDLGGTFPGSRVELAVGLDLMNTDSFVNPVREPLQIFEDPMFHRQRRAGLYAWKEEGFGSLDNRRTLLLAI